MTMVNTWTYVATNVNCNSGNQDKAIIRNAGASRFIRIRRVGFLNDQRNAVAPAALCAFSLLRGTVSVGPAGTAVTLVPHDTLNSALDTVTAYKDGSITFVEADADITLRKIIWSPDEPAIGEATIDEMEVLVPLGIVWDAGYGTDGVCQPILLRPTDDQAFSVRLATSRAGLMGIWMDISDEAS